MQSDGLEGVDEHSPTFLVDSPDQLIEMLLRCGEVTDLKLEGGGALFQVV